MDPAALFYERFVYSVPEARDSLSLLDIVTGKTISALSPVSRAIEDRLDTIINCIKELKGLDDVKYLPLVLKVRIAARDLVSSSSSTQSVRALKRWSGRSRTLIEISDSDLFVRLLAVKLHCFSLYTRALIEDNCDDRYGFEIKKDVLGRGRVGGHTAKIKERLNACVCLLAEHPHAQSAGRLERGLSGFFWNGGFLQESPYGRGGDSLTRCIFLTELGFLCWNVCHLPPNGPAPPVIDSDPENGRPWALWRIGEEVLIRRGWKVSQKMENGRFWGVLEKIPCADDLTTVSSTEGIALLLSLVLVSKNIDALAISTSQPFPELNRLISPVMDTCGKMRHPVVALNLSECQITDETLSDLSFGSLQSLDLSFNLLTDKCLSSILCLINSGLAEFVQGLASVIGKGCTLRKLEMTTGSELENALLMRDASYLTPASIPVTPMSSKPFSSYASTPQITYRKSEQRPLLFPVSVDSILEHSKSSAEYARNFLQNQQHVISQEKDQISILLAKRDSELFGYARKAIGSHRVSRFDRINRLLTDHPFVKLQELEWDTHKS